MLEIYDFFFCDQNVSAKPTIFAWMSDGSATFGIYINQTFSEK
jgi:hypothetical protein